MKIARTLQLAALVIATTPVFAQQLPPAIRQQLDASAAKFTGAEATMTYDNFNHAVPFTDHQKGITYAKKGEVGIKILDEGSQRTVVLKDGKARDYIPASKCYNAYDLSKNKGTINSVLALSFGASGKELDANWLVTDLGSEQMDATINGKAGSVKVEKLDLVPRDPNLKNTVAHFTLWTDLSHAIALKYIFYAPDKDTKTATYSNIKVNQSVDTKPFEIGGKPCNK